MIVSRVDGERLEGELTARKVVTHAQPKVTASSAGLDSMVFRTWRMSSRHFGMSVNVRKSLGVAAEAREMRVERRSRISASELYFEEREPNS